MFRMTVVPYLHTDEDVWRVAESLHRAARFVIQGFRPQNTLDLAYSSIRPYSPEKLEALQRRVDALMAIQKA
jgi:hypothetical protein